MQLSVLEVSQTVTETIYFNTQYLDEIAKLDLAPCTDILVDQETERDLLAIQLNDLFGVASVDLTHGYCEITLPNPIAYSPDFYLATRGLILAEIAQVDIVATAIELKRDYDAIDAQ